MRFDKAAGDLESFKSGYKTMNYIENGTLEELTSLFEIEPANMGMIKDDLKVLKGQMPMDENTAPPLFKDQKRPGFYYERNFYDPVQQRIVLQIHLVLTKKGNVFFISTIEFRRDNQIGRRDKELKQLEEVDENADMPPPPPPPR